MYSKKDIEKTLIEFNYFIDEVTLNNFIKNWKIDAIYEDEDGVEFYDNMAIAKLKKGISLKSQGFSNDQIIYHINKILPEKLSAKKEEEEKKEVPAISTSTSSEMKNVTIDVTHQTLQMLADAVALKITSDIKEQIKTSDFAKQLLEDSSLKKDNEELSQKIEELTDDNKKLAKRVEELEKAKKKTLINFEYFLNVFK
jgi:hypothetical protein